MSLTDLSIGGGRSTLETFNTYTFKLIQDLSCAMNIGEAAKTSISFCRVNKMKHLNLVLKVNRFWPFVAF